MFTLPRWRLLAAALSMLMLVALVGLVAPPSAAAEGPIEQDRYVVGGCRISFDSGGHPALAPSAGRPCVGVSSLGVDARGDLVVRVTPQVQYPWLRIMVQAGATMSGRGITSSATGNGKHLTVRLYDDRNDRRLDLRYAHRRARVARTDLVVGWTKVTPAGSTAKSLLKDPGYDALGPYRDRTATSETTVPGGCVVRFDSATPRIHANAHHRCIGVSSVSLSSDGHLQLRSSAEQRGAVVNVQADPDEALTTRGLVTGVSASPSLTVVRIYDTRLRRQLDLRTAKDYARVAGPTANLWLSWTKTTSRPGVSNALTTPTAGAYGPWIDGSVLPTDVRQSGCRIRFTTKPQAALLYGNRYHLCAEVTGVVVTASGDLSVRGGSNPIVSTTTIATSGKTDHGLRAGISGGTGRTDVRIYSLKLNRRLDLRRVADRNVMVSDGAEMFLGWSRYTGPL